MNIGSLDYITDYASIDFSDIVVTRYCMSSHSILIHIIICFFFPYVPFKIISFFEGLLDHTFKEALLLLIGPRRIKPQRNVG